MGEIKATPSETGPVHFQEHAHDQEVVRVASSSSRRFEQDSTQAWWLVVGGFLVMFNIWGLPISFGAFQEFYTLHYLRSYTVSDIAWIGTVQNALQQFVGLLSGPLYDLGYWRYLLATGTLLTVFGMMMLSLSTQYYQIFLTQAVCVGVGCGLLYIPILTLIGAAFTEKRALAMGVLTSGIAMGGVIYTIVYLRLLPVVGFPWMTRIMAFINLSAFVIAIPMVIRQPETTRRARQLFDRAALTDAPFLLFTTIQLFVFLGYLVPLFYIPTYAQVVLHFDQSASLYLLVGAQAASLFGRLAATVPVRYIGVMVPWAVSCCIAGVLCFTWIAATSKGAFIAFSVLYGFFSGALISLPPGLFPIICPDKTKLGSRFGVSWTAVGFANLVGSPIAGAIVNVDNKNFLGAQAWSGAVLLSASLLIIVLWVVLTKRHGRALL